MNNKRLIKYELIGTRWQWIQKPSRPPQEYGFRKEKFIVYSFNQLTKLFSIIYDDDINDMCSESIFYYHIQHRNILPVRSIFVMKFNNSERMTKEEERLWEDWWKNKAPLLLKQCTIKT